MTKVHEAYCNEKLSQRLFNDGYHGDNINGLYVPDEEWDVVAYYISMSCAMRFFRATPIRDAQKEGHRDQAILSIVSLRQQKALHLYHLIREYKLFEWWD